MFGRGSTFGQASAFGRTGALVTAGALLALGGAIVLKGTPWRSLSGSSGERNRLDARGSDPADAGGASAATATPPASTASTTPLRETSASDGRGDFSDEERERGARRAAESRRPVYLRLGTGLVVSVGLGLTPLGSGVVESAGRLVGDGWVGQATLGAAALLGLGSLATLPFSVWSERLARRWGLSVQSWGSWALDHLKGLAIGVVLLLVVVPAAFALARAAPDRWWIVGALAAVALVVLLSFVFPVVVEPLFAKFRPLEPGPLRDELLALAEADGVAVTDVLVADASRRTTALNAYVSGFGRTRRIVVFDTLLDGAPAGEVRLVVAHELGHAKEQDVLQGTAVAAVLTAFTVVLLQVVLTTPVLLRRAGAGGVRDPRSLPLALLTVQVVGTLTGPVLNLMSRRIEERADVHSLDLTRDATSFVEAERRLALTNLADLDPPLLARALFGSHPTVPDRIALARRWAVREGLAVPGPLLAGISAP